MITGVQVTTPSSVIEHKLPRTLETTKSQRGTESDFAGNANESVDQIIYHQIVTPPGSAGG